MKSSTARAAAVVVGLAASFALTACGTSSSGTSDSGSSQAGSNQAGSSQNSNQGGSGQGGMGGANVRPGVTGTIAAKSGKTLQVQASSTQTAVTYSGSTSITKTVSASASDVKVGECVTAMPQRAASDDESSGGSSSDAGSSATIATVTISSANSTGQCDAGGFGMGARSGGQPPNGKSGTGRPSGQPSAIPSGAPTGGPKGARVGGPASGVVTSVKGMTITVKARAVQPPGQSGSSQSGTGKSSTQKITVASSTKYTKTVKTYGSALSVGKCVMAQGKSASDGSFTATSIRVSKGGTCTTSGAPAGAGVSGGSTND